MKISVFGLGYVGCITAACFAAEGHDVIGVDVNALKVDAINAGRSPLIEAGLTEKIAEGVSTKRLSATLDSEKGVLGSDISFVCVGTPSSKNGSLDTGFLETVSREIGEALSKKEGRHLIVNRSTSLPGTLKKLGQIVQDASGRVKGLDFVMVSNPEFLREGAAIDDFYEPSYTVIGMDEGVDNWAGSVLKELYGFVSAPMVFLSVEEAELIKYANNYFHALKITFANEIGRIAKQVGVDARNILNLVVEDTKLNLSPYYMKPGFAFGGSCLPKDLRALSHFARTRDTFVPVVDAVMGSNDAHITHSFDLITGNGRSRVGIVGLTFKEKTDDLRESATVRLAERLIGKGYPIRIYDPNVFDKKLIGSNRQFILEQLPHFFELLTENIGELIECSEIIVITQRIKMRDDVLAMLGGKHVVDVIGLDDVRNHCGHYEGICW